MADKTTKISKSSRKHGRNLKKPSKMRYVSSNLSDGVKMSDVIPGILGGLGSVAGVLMGVGSGSNERNLEAMRGNLEAQLGFSALQRQMVQGLAHNQERWPREYINLEPLPKPLADALTYGQWGVGEPKDQYVWIHDRSQFEWIHNRSTYHKN